VREKARMMQATAAKRKVRKTVRQRLQIRNVNLQPHPGPRLAAVTSDWPWGVVISPVFIRSFSTVFSIVHVRRDVAAVIAL
jgi:hypothetical protein